MNGSIVFTVVWFHGLVTVFIVSVVLLTIRPRLMPALLALFLGLLAAVIDLHSDEVQFPALLLLAFSFFAAFNGQRGAWRWALLVGVWVPVFQIVRTAGRPGEQFLNEGLGSILALVPAFLGAYAAAAARNLQARRSARRAEDSA